MTLAKLKTLVGLLLDNNLTSQISEENNNYTVSVVTNGATTTQVNSVVNAVGGITASIKYVTFN